MKTSMHACAHLCVCASAVVYVHAHVYVHDMHM